jgi:predicted amidophosphoribosyltransferase
MCPKCRKLCCRDADKFCRKCGAHLGAPDNHCEDCGAEVGTSDIYCHQCQRKLNPPNGEVKR